MKRIYSGILILTLMLLFALAGNIAVGGSIHALDARLAQAEADCEQGNFTTAAEALNRCAAHLRRHEPLLAFYVRRGMLAELQQSFAAALAFAQSGTGDELAAELGRARQQLAALDGVFFSAV